MTTFENSEILQEKNVDLMENITNKNEIEDSVLDKYFMENDTKKTIKLK